MAAGVLEDDRVLEMAGERARLLDRNDTVGAAEHVKRWRGVAVGAFVEACEVGIVTRKTADHDREIEAERSLGRRSSVRRAKPNEQAGERGALAEPEDSVERTLRFEERD